MPALVLNETEEFQLVDGSLIIPSYDLICKLDPYYNIDEGRFQKSRPVFYYSIVDCDNSEKDFWISSFETTVKDLHLALSIEPGTHLLPTPTQSISYIRVDSKTIIKGGAFQRDWMLYGNVWPAEFDLNALKKANCIFDYLADFHSIKTFEPLKKAIDVLNETANVEFAYKGIGYDEYCLDYKFGFVRIVQLLESILFADITKRFDLGITDSFGLYWSLLLEPDINMVPNTAIELSTYYRLRSKLIHGESHLDFDSEVNRNKYLKCRFLFAHTIKILMILCKEKFSCFDKKYSTIDYLPWSDVKYKERDDIGKIMLNPLRRFLDKMLEDDGGKYKINEELFNEFHQFIQQKWNKIFS